VTTTLTDADLAARSAAFERAPAEEIIG